ncbi:hypothetical protein ACSVI9_06325 [Pseudomonas aeruginosa]|uniref:hypothetical protein n=1 Tax=Pseudomonas aeruginosa TaxID=287 RepID=UPI000F52543B|nr:hypothetical protein [Pseudomonas aeruginosa]MBH4233343.1 hypothetical protein [Pseudomonas aeruginosa]MDU0578567.1 hypothetical protein [Pseudomonas aeruginosa]MDU0717206.1 hypothetical protein [Pseudomonas aeruginosa]HCF1163690.1 hypothetical protein [Pseudomonas aeruginosa]
MAIPHRHGVARAAYAFTSALALLLKHLGKHNVMEEPNILGIEPDIIYGQQDSLTMIETKLYRRSSPPPASIFKRALEHTHDRGSRIGAVKIVLAISCPMGERFFNVAQAFPTVEVWDETKLFEMAAPFPEILTLFEEIFEADTPKSVETLSISSPTPIPDADVLASEPKKGKVLAEALAAIERGRDMATDFENACINALKYLFEKDLHGWHEQSRTVDTLHRRDLVCRIMAKAAEVWRLMLEDLGSRYVVFEFKNYSKPITQNEIVTTERYLYPSALRKVAIVISHEDCADSAKLVIAGAMRENGKLIIPLSVPEIIDLLNTKDEGSDPNTYLFERVDQFLLGLGR